MNRLTLSTIALAGALCLSGAAEAASVFEFRMQGVVTAEIPPDGDHVDDVNIHVGDRVTMSARFGADRFMPDGSGTTVALHAIAITDLAP